MNIRMIAFASCVSVGLAFTARADQAAKLSTVVIDDSAMVPRQETLTKDTTCTEQGKCVDKLNYVLDCRSGVYLRVSLVQPRGAQAQVTDVTNHGKSLGGEGHSAINKILNQRPALAKAEMEGMCSANGAAIYLSTYADAFLKSRHRVGEEIVLSVSPSGEENVSTRRVDDDR